MPDTTKCIGLNLLLKAKNKLGATIAAKCAANTLLLSTRLKPCACMAKGVAFITKVIKPKLKQHTHRWLRENGVF
ncbi:hypothetical protein NHP21005_17810 [Helicobacter sp. NHP21005]|nr:hypothetical protein NHP21005_17810 [Helicobacter sp. NHP21005]